MEPNIYPGVMEWVENFLNDLDEEHYDENNNEFTIDDFYNANAVVQKIKDRYVVRNMNNDILLKGTNDRDILYNILINGNQLWNNDIWI